MKNEFGINMLRFEKTVYPFCPMGNDSYAATIRVEFAPGEEMFDFVKIDKMLKDITGSKWIIEEVTNRVYSLMMNYKPRNLKVVVEAHSNVHFPVTVEKCMALEE